MLTVISSSGNREMKRDMWFINVLSTCQFTNCVVRTVQNECVNRTLFLSILSYSSAWFAIRTKYVPPLHSTSRKRNHTNTMSKSLSSKQGYRIHNIRTYATLMVKPRECPQGVILSPLLWASVVNELLYDICREMYGKNLGIHPKMTLWLYVYTKVNSLASKWCAEVSMPMRHGIHETAATSVMEVLLYLKPLHLHIYTKRRSANSWRSTPEIDSRTES